jgi:hypothetical protein
MNDVRDDIEAERRHLVTTLHSVGPEATILAGDWLASDVARHLAAQDRARGPPAWAARRLVLATGLRLTAAYLDRPAIAALVNAGPRDWERCITRLERDPPTLLTGAAAPITLWEYFVHHEDIRRPNHAQTTTAPDLTPVITWLTTYNRRRLERLGGAAYRRVAGGRIRRRRRLSRRRRPQRRLPRGGPGRRPFGRTDRGEARSGGRPGERTACPVGLSRCSRFPPIPA